MRNRLVASASGAAVIAAALTACAGAAPSCAGPHAEIPAQVSAGETVTLQFADVITDCGDTGGGWVDIPDDFVVALRHNTDQPVAVTTVAVASDATATVELPIPATASGIYQVVYEDPSMPGAWVIVANTTVVQGN